MSFTYGGFTFETVDDADPSDIQLIVAELIDQLVLGANGFSKRAPIALGNSVKTADYTAADADAGTAIVFNSASDLVLTIPSTLADGWSALVVRFGTGDVTIAKGAGTHTLDGWPGLKVAQQYAAATVAHVATISASKKYLALGVLSA
jgi:hypothetical protein